MLTKIAMYIFAIKYQILHPFYQKYKICFFTIEFVLINTNDWERKGSFLYKYVNIYISIIYETNYTKIGQVCKISTQVY